MKRKVVVYLYRYEGKEWLSFLDKEYRQSPPPPKCDKCGAWPSYYIYTIVLNPISSTEVDIEIEDDDSNSKVTTQT